MAVAVTKKPPEKKTEEELLKVDIEFKGVKMILPEDMDYDEGIQALMLKKKEANTTVEVSASIRAFPMDGAVQFQAALVEIYGQQVLVPTPTFWGPEPPLMIGVEVDYNKMIQVPWGLCQVPKIEGKLGTGVAYQDELPVFQLQGTVKRRKTKSM